MMILSLLCIALAGYFFFSSLSLWVGDGQVVSKDRLHRYLPPSQNVSAESVSLEKTNHLSELPILNRFLSQTALWGSCLKWIRQSGMNMSLGVFLLLTAVLATAPPVLLSALHVGSSTSALMMGLSFASIPFLIVQSKRKKRQKAFEKAFPDAIGRLASSLRAGYSLQIAVENLVKDVENIVGEEFRHLLTELEVGQPFETALSKMTDRIDTADLRLFIASVTIQRESGGNLSTLLCNLEHTIRERFQLRRELAAATGQAKLSGLVLSLLPVFVAIFVYMIHKEYILFFFEDPAGKTLFWMAVWGQALGMFTIRKIIKIEM